MSTKSKDKLNNAARELFWKNGINNTSIEEICDKAKLSKMTFYRNYPSKFELIKEIIDTNYDTIEENYKKILSKPIPFNEKIGELVYSNFESVQGVSQAFLYDVVKQKNSKVKKYVDKKQAANHNLMISYIKEEQKKGNFRQDINLDFLMAYMYHIYELLFNQDLLQIYNSSPDLLYSEINKMFFYGILER